MKNRKQVLSSLLLLFAAALWGASYVVQKTGGSRIGAFTLNSLRGFVGAAVLLPGLLFRNRKNPLSPEIRKRSAAAGAAAGVILTAATLFQQFGIMGTTVGKAGFITSLHVVLVPLLGLLAGKRGRPVQWIGTAVTLAGLYLLCFKGEASLNMGDLLTLAGALFFSLHMIFLEKYSGNSDGILLSAVQFLVCGVLCAVPMLIVDRPSLSDLASSWPAVLYAGAVSFGLGATLQVYVQRSLSASSTAIIMSTESVFAAVAGWIFLREYLSPREIAGCALILLATLLVQLPMILRDRRKSPPAAPRD